MYLKYICILEKAMRKTTKARSETSPGSTPVLKADLLGYTIKGLCSLQFIIQDLPPVNLYLFYMGVFGRA